MSGIGFWDDAASDLASHLADTSDAHDASAISYAGGTGISATDVEAAIDELATEKADLASPTFTGLPNGPQWKSTGITGANTTPLTISGANASGAPASGAHVKGEIAGDDTGKLWYCTVAGTPGTWVNVGGGSGSVATDSIFDAKGDLPVGTAADTAARLAVGTNGHVLTADSAETTGLKWAAAGSGSVPIVSWVHGDGGGAHTTTSTSLADVAAAYSLTIAAAVGDDLEAEFEGVFEHSVGSNNFVALGINISGTGDKTVQRLWAFPSSGNGFIGSVRVFHTVVSGDITGGLVTVKPRWRTNTGTATLRNETTNNQKPVMSVKNWRQ